MLRGLAVVATTVLVAAVSGPALAQETLEGLQSVVEFVSEQSETDLEVNLIPAPTGGAVVTERAGDFEHLTGEPPRFTPNYMDIRQGAFFELQPGPAEMLGRTTGSPLWSPSGPKAIDPRDGPAFFTYTGHLPKDGSQYQEGALLFEMTLQEPPPPQPEGRCDFTVWVNDGARGTRFQNLPNFPLDPAAGSNVAFGLRLAPPAGGVPVTFSLTLDEAGGFQRADTDVRAYLVGDTVGIIVPRSAVAGLAEVNYHTVCWTGDSAVDPATAGADQTGLLPANLGEAGIISIVETPVTATPTVPETTTITTRPDMPSVTEPVEDSGPGAAVWAPAAAAAALLGSIAYWAFARQRNPEERALANWRKAELALRHAENSAEPLIVACLEAGAVLEDLEHERVDLCRVWPPICLDEEANGAEGLTTQDQHLRRMALGELWVDYQDGEIGVEEVEARWRQVDTPEFRDRMRDSNEAYGETLAQLDDEIAAARAVVEPACAQGAAAAARVDAARAGGAAARKAYLETVQTPTALPLPAATWLTDECSKQTAPRLSPDGPVERIRINVGFMLTIGRFAGKERNLERGERLVLEMEGLLHELELTSTMDQVRRAGVHTNWSGHEYEPGVYWVTADGIVRVESEEVSAPAGEAAPVRPTPNPVPSLSHLPASIGDHATGRIAGWMIGFETLTMQRIFFHQLITSRPYTLWDCQDGVWSCRERAWRVEIGEPLRNRGEVRWFSTGSPGRRAQFETEVNRLAWVATGVVTRDLRRLARWRAKHVASPCPHANPGL